MKAFPFQRNAFLGKNRKYAEQLILLLVGNSCQLGGYGDIMSNDEIIVEYESS